jgi:fucose 4-O-acetylase-like acetyltransferase
VESANVSRTTYERTPGAPAARLGYIDVIKGLVVAGVIVAHAAMTYGLFGNWPYQETVHPLPQTIGYAIAFVAMLGMGMLFLVAGLFTPAAIGRKGPSGFLADRAMRLGIPTVAFLLAIMPGANFLGRWVSGSSPASAASYALEHLRRFDLGSMWFVFALLLVTVGYVGWRALSRPRAAGVGGGGLLLIVVLSAVATFLVRTIQPVYDPAPINVAGWPPDFALFALGTLAGGGWLARVPERTTRQAAALVAGGILILAPLAVHAPTDFSRLVGGWHWESALVSSSESLVTIGLAIWILRQFQRIGHDPLPSVTSGSFTVYLIQTPVIILLGLALRRLALAPELKAAVLAVLGLVVCFGFASAYRGWRRTSGRRRRRGRRGPVGALAHPS